jgi:hypothetical protein
MQNILSNVNGIYKYKNWDTLKESSKQLKEHEVDIIGFAETNVKWNLHIRNQVTSVLQKAYKIVQTTTSSNNEPRKNHYQPGGTFTAATSKYTGRIRSTITDDSNMGRWSGFTLSTNFQHNLHIITVYQSVKSEGIHSTYIQQMSRLSDMGHKNPNPRKQLFDDLQALISKWNDQRDITIILIDANDNLYTKDSLLPNLLSKKDLASLISNPKEHPPIHARGSRCIDYILGSSAILQHVKASGITAFYDPPYIHSDHRGLFVDIDELALFGANLNTIIPPTPRKLISTSKTLVTKFLDAIDKEDKITNLLARITELQDRQTWTSKQHEHLEKIDEEFTQILLLAESQSSVPTGYSWSTTLDSHSRIYNYWSIKIRGISNNINIRNKLQEIEQQIPINVLHHNLRSTNPIVQLRHARRNLINSRLQSDDLRENHHTILHDRLISEEKLSKAKAIQQQKNKERRRRCWRTFRILKTGPRATGGITHVLKNVQ